jgi:uncharacterized alkaline shock family protein YloU
LPATISTDILARYAADAAREVEGIRGLVESHLPRHRGVRITDDRGRIAVELHVAVDWGTAIPAAGREVQRRVVEYLQRMADVRPATVDVVVDEIGPP